MANIERIVKCDISLNTTGVSSEGFSTMIVIGPHAYTTTRVLSVTDSDELLELGFNSKDAIYVAVNDAFSQTPKPSVVKVGRLQCDTVKVGVVGHPTKGMEYKFSIESIDENGEAVSYPFTYTASESDSVESVLSALVNAVTGNSGVNAKYTASVVDSNIVVKCNDAAHSFYIKPNSLMKVVACEQAESIDLATNMALITAADNDFYGICYVNRDPDAVMEMAEWVESHTKLFGTATGADGVKNPEVETDIGSKLKNGNYYRTFWFYHKDAATDYPDAGVMARCFAVLPGGETWANKRLAGVTTDRLTEGEYKAITDKNGNTFEPFRNVTITQNGKVAAGEWIDVIRFRDWLTETIQTEVFSVMINRDKLPYTDAGIAIVENTINAVLELGQTRGGIAPTEFDEDGNKNLGYSISVPKASGISANVKAQRVLRDVKFTARLAGAIHAVEIKGSLTYENLTELA